MGLIIKLMAAMTVALCRRSQSRKLMRLCVVPLVDRSLLYTKKPVTSGLVRGRHDGKRLDDLDTEPARLREQAFT